MSPEELAKIQEIVINGPPTPPPGFVRPLAPRQGAFRTLNAASLAVPTSMWTYGCTATSAGMLFAYYDRNGFPNMYTGPCNGGVCPLTDLGQGCVLESPIPGSCSIIATQNGFDGRLTRGYRDDYWISSGSDGPDPWEGNWTEHTWEGCTADFMGTGQWKWDCKEPWGSIDAISDGGTKMYTFGSSKLYDYIPPASYGLPQTEACHGMRLFAESRGYTVLENYSQKIDAKVTGGFSFDEYMAEIDAGCPVLIHVDGHSMIGVGYDQTDNTVYIHDTWDNSVHTMTWGGSYSGMEHLCVTVIHLYRDTTPPTVSSITRAGTNPTNAASVQFTVTFSETVTGGGVSNFSLSGSGGVTGPSVTGVTGSGATRTVTVNTGTGDGNLRLNMANSTGVMDLCENLVSNVPFNTGQNYTIDKTAPTVDSITRVGANPTNASSVQFTVTFSESVTGVGTSNFSLTEGGGVTGASVTGVTGSGATRTVTVNTGTGDGALRLNMANSTGATDTAGNAVSNVPYTGGQTYTIDKTAPMASSITRVGTSPTNAASVQFTVTFSESVAGVVPANFSVAVTGGITGPSVTGVSGSGTTRTVTVDTGTGDGNLRLNMANSTGVADAAGNAVENVPYTAGEAYTIDKTGPTVSITRSGTNPTNASSVQFTVTFNESVTGVVAGNFSLSGSGGITSPSIIDVTGSDTTRTVTVNTGTGDGGLRLNMANSTGVADTAGNPVADLPYTGGQIYTIDKTPPTVSSITRAGTNPTNAASVQFTVTFSESVTGSGPSNFSLTATGGITGVSVTGVAGSGATRTVTVNTGTGNGTVRLNMANSTAVADDAGNAVSNVPYTAGEVYTVDKTAPAVLSVTSSLANGTYTTGQVVPIQVTFGEVVTYVAGGGSAQLKLETGTTDRQALYAGGSGTTVFTFNYTVQAGDTSPDLEYFSINALTLTPPATLRDAATNNATLTLPTLGSANSLGGSKNIVIDAVAPTVSMSSTAPNPTDVSPIPVTVTFSETVTGFTDTDVVAGNSVVSDFSGLGANYTFKLTPSSLGLVTADIAAGIATDAAGNGNVAATQFVRTLAAPAITGDPVGGSFYVGDSIAFTVTATGGVPPLSYQWRLDGSAIADKTNITLELDLLAVDDHGDYDCVVSNSGVASATSDVATLKVEDHLQISMQPEGAYLNPGDPYTLLVETEGGYLPLTYQWSKDESPIEDATSSFYEIALFSETDAGAYTVHVVDNYTDHEDSIPAALALISAKVPIASLNGLVTLLGGCLLAGAATLRKKR